MKKIAILGSTGSIGTQTLQVISANPDKFSVSALVANNSGELLEKQRREFLPIYSGLYSTDSGALTKAVNSGADVVVVATTGIVALNATLYCLVNGIDVALANKETLVVGGALIKDALKKTSARLIPVDSEHSAVFQCIEYAKQKPDRIILTASGGAFRNKTLDELKNADYKAALKHPNWNMGAKITIDSATMFNKTLEIIEAKWLFDTDISKIDVLIQPQSRVHSMIKLSDGSVYGQVAPPDMRDAIKYALSYPTPPENIRPIDINSGEFEFYKPDTARFPCITLAYDKLIKIPLMPTVMNAANDVCVEEFSKNSLCFCDFWNIIHNACEHFEKELSNSEITISNIVFYDKLARQYSKELIEKL